MVAAVVRCYHVSGVVHPSPRITAATSQTREMETSDGDTLTLHHPALAPLESSNLDIDNYGELLIQTIIHGNYY